MDASRIFLYLLFVFGLSVARAVAQDCTVSAYSGACISTTTCKKEGGHSTPGHCPGPTSIQCCTYGSCSVNGQTGKCIDNTVCRGTSTAGHCPGPTNIQCCTSGYGKCSVNGVSGTCIATTKCTGKSTPGHCPGPTNIQCCTSSPSSYGKCSVSGVSGTCVNTATCTGTSTPGHCPGPSYIQCCTKSITNSGTGGKIVSWARTQKGKYPYSWGGGHRASPGPSTGCCSGCGYSGPLPCRASTTVGYDCSGFTRWAVWKATGADILGSGSTVNQEGRLGSGRRVYGSFKPGDIIFYGTPSTHTAIYAGGTQIEALHTGTLVMEDSYRPGTRYYRIQ